MIQEQLAKVGVAVTGSSTGITFWAAALPVVQFIAAVVAVLVGVVTGTYYVLAAVEKYRNLRKK